MSGQIEGLPNVLANLRGFADKVQKKVLRGAVDYAATPVVKAAKANVVVKSGTLKRALTKKTKTYSSAVCGIIGAKNSPQTVNGKIVNPAMYSHLVEGGTKPHMAGKRNHPGAKAQPFLSVAYNQTKNEVQNRFVQKVQEKIDKLT